MQVMETRKRVPVDEHPNTLTSMNNLAHTFCELGRSDEALALMRDCVYGRQRILGSEHPYAVSSLKTLETWEQDHVYGTLS